MTRTHPEPTSPTARAKTPADALGGRQQPRLRILAPALAVALGIGTFALFAGRPTNDPYQPQRRAMVEQQIVRRGVVQTAVLDAMREVPRHEFVPSSWRSWSYTDRPLPIGFDQTISQPYIVARMTELLRLDKDSKVLEIGTGSGYHAAVLSRVAGRVYSIEILQPLADRARRTLEHLGFDNVQVKVADGYRGWPEEAPFDAIVLTAAPADIPAPLLEQLKIGGRMVLPQGTGNIQELLLVTKTAESLQRERIAAVRFVPMTGEARKER